MLREALRGTESSGDVSEGEGHGLPPGPCSSAEVCGCWEMSLSICGSDGRRGRMRKSRCEAQRVSRGAGSGVVLGKSHGRSVLGSETQWCLNYSHVFSGIVFVTPAPMAILREQRLQPLPEFLFHGFANCVECVTGL